MTTQTHSYPSGNVAGTAALMGALLLVYRGSVRPLLVVAAPVVVGIIAVTRLYLGVHWLSDTIAGTLVGAFFVLGALLVSQLARDRMSQPAVRRVVLPESAPPPSRKP
jgi:membrane-associated phospholipid phosphatase